MRISSLIFFFITLFTAPIFAEVYKCEDGGVTHFSISPCSDQPIDLALSDEVVRDDLVQQEHLIAPPYPTWPGGWKKSKDLRLERFFEIVYVPIVLSEAVKHTKINQQKLTNLPQSMSVQRFAVSVEDIIESICANAVVYEPELTNKNSNKVYYGQYICSYRRDTKQGELGFYKIMRGENSIYMTTVKWAVKSFAIPDEDPLQITQSTEQKNNISTAQSYLFNHVKLCHLGTCL